MCFCYNVFRGSLLFFVWLSFDCFPIFECVMCACMCYDVFVCGVACLCVVVCFVCVLCACVCERLCVRCAIVYFYVLFVLFLFVCFDLLCLMVCSRCLSLIFLDV